MQSKIFFIILMTVALIMPLFGIGSPEASGASGTSAGQAGAGGQLITMVVTFGLIIVIFYFLVLRPQNKKQKETQKMLAAVKKGDRVVTIGGIRAVVASVKEDAVVLKVDDNTKIEFSKSAISQVLERKEEKEEEKAKEESVQKKD